MEIIFILSMSVIILLILIMLLKNNLKSMKLIKQIGEDVELNKITNSLPENEQICKEMLSMLNNENVKIKVGNENTQASLYVVASNSIFIANIKNTFTRVQTIAHECLHSIQDKKMLWFNFIFSNIYILYFFIITIIALFNKLKYSNIFAIILVMMSMLLYFVRSFLETDAMTKAKYLAKEYIENKGVLSKENIQLIIENYDKINSVGIIVTNFSLIFSYLIKVIIFCLAVLI